MTRAQPVYPWSAVVGQDALKQALILCAIDPGIGGVLVDGPRGVAKTTVARALGELMEGPFAELPLGATEERVTGSLDLARVLSENQVQFAPGLLARAHQGVLYVDEVNLLPDMLVDLLLDAAASGQNLVERDGVSHVHPARFVLIGTMNPEEGALRPQLIDRFGLSVRAAALIAPGERSEIVERRLAFDRDPVAFRARFAAAQTELIARCRAARALAQDVPLSGPGLARVSELCYAARVEGVRADLAMLRAARAHAAWHARREITPHDVDAVAEFALAHRRRTSPDSDPSGGSAPGRPAGSAPGSNPTPGHGSSASPLHGAADSGSDPDHASQGTRGAAGRLAPVPAPSIAPATLPEWLTLPRGLSPDSARRGKTRIAASSGRRGPLGSSGGIDWFATFARGRPCSTRDLRRRVRRSQSRQLWIVALDCSASMQRGRALGLAKGIAHALEARALQAGAHLALISFRGDRARTELTSRPGRTQYASSIAQLSAAGGTPLESALLEAFRISRDQRWCSRAIDKRLILLTDGRTREAITVATRVPAGLELTVVDCERTSLRLGRAATIARGLCARYIHVDELGVLS